MNEEIDTKTTVIRATTITDPLSGKFEPVLGPGEQVYEPGMIELLKGKELEKLKKFGCHFTKNGPVTIVGQKAFECITRNFDYYEYLIDYIKENPGIMIYEIYRNKLSEPNKYRIRFYGRYNCCSAFGPLCMSKFDAWLFENRGKLCKYRFIFKIIQKYFAWRGYDKNPTRMPAYMLPFMKPLKDGSIKKVKTTKYDEGREKDIMETMAKATDKPKEKSKDSLTEAVNHLSSF